MVFGTGTRIASGSDDLMIKIWDWEKRKEVITFPTGHRENVFQVETAILSFIYSSFLSFIY